MKYRRWQPLLVLGPSIARVIAGDGWSKDDVRRYLHERVTIPARLAETYAWHLGSTAFSLGPGDPDRPLAVFPWPQEIGIVVAGDPGRNQSKGYCNNHLQGGRVSRTVVPA
jgi:hypothetical protein